MEMCLGGQEGNDELDKVWSWNLLPEISLLVFSKLPVKSLMRCRCVCKDWRASISTSHLINTHLACAPHAYNPDIVFRDFHIISRYRFKREISVVENVGCPDEIKKQLPLPPHLTALDVVDSCNGLLCLREPFSQKYMCVHNPCTGESVHLPELPFPLSQRQSSVFGFGHNPILDEYKVLALFIEDLKSDPLKQVAEVYTLGSSSWRRIGEVPFKPIGAQSYFFRDGALHWMSFHSADNSLFGFGSFDIGSETFEFVPLPQEIFPNVDLKQLEVGVLRGSVAVVNFSSHEHVEIWETKDHRVHGSWTKQYVLAMPKNLRSLRLLCVLMNGNILLLYNENKLVSCDPRNGVMRDHRLQGVSAISESFIHVGTLVSPIRDHAWRHS